MGLSIRKLPIITLAFSRLAQFPPPGYRGPWSAVPLFADFYPAHRADLINRHPAKAPDSPYLTSKGSLKLQAESRQEILSILQKLYQALNWDESTKPDWNSFSDCFHATARLYPSARPVEALDVDTFVGRMDGQRSNGNLATFAETMLGEDIQVFGNVAVAFSAYETVINGDRKSRGLNAFHLGRDDGTWKILSLAWDNETDEQPLPELPREQA